jgi:hypothetical protein
MPRKSTKKRPARASDGTHTDPALQEAYEAGFRDGHDEGYEEGYEEGTEYGLEMRDPADESEEADITDEELYQKGHAAGYARGYEEGSATVVHEAKPRTDEEDVGEDEELGDDGKIRPLRRVVGAHNYITWRGNEYFADLSCGHMDEEPRPEAVILKDAGRRRRLACDQCQRDY